ncbi:MAG TPA: tail fiber domain-containing protein [Thermoanaerobaculia bacterium]|nr:tail fiber domain-containing protein [Thermoanaerobaculia bacterium]
MTQTHARVSAIFSFLALAISVAAFAAKPGFAAPAIGDPNISASAIQWQTSGAYERLILTVSSPDGYSLSKEFEAGRAATLRVQELGAKVPADGQYTWELRVVPHVSAETRQQLAAAREAGDDQAAARIQAEAGLNRDIVRSGAFAVLGGSFVVSEGEEPATPGGRKVAADALKPVTQDVVTADDEIIQGSLCVGLDCVVNESFGFDTIRLKENNTRIKFDDTSTSAGFPANDWQLTANDSASGGANKFSIDDTTNNKTPFTITGNAPTNSIFVANSGKVGFRTAAPVLDLHITTGDTPAIRQEQTAASGFTAQTWDIGANEANWFVRDVTGGSRLPLRIRPGAPTSSIDISASGNVGIGTASPTNGRIAVKGSGWFENGTTDHAVRIVPGTTGGSHLIDSNYSLTGTFLALRLSANASSFPNELYLGTDGNIGIGTSSPANPIQHSSGAILTAGGVWQNASSRELKEDICPLGVDEARATLLHLDPVTFAYKIDPQEHHAGFIAEDVPDLVAAKDRKSLSAMDIVAVLTKVTQEQQKVIDQLSKRVEQLEKDAQNSQK